MNVAEVYRTISTPDIKCPQPMFIAHFNDTQMEIANLYGDKYVSIPGTHIETITAVEDGSNLRDEYFGAVCDKIRFLISADEKYLALYNGKRESAYSNVWRKLSRNKKVKAAEWG